MALNTSASAALFLATNLLFFSLVSSCGYTCTTPSPPPPKKPPTPKPCTPPPAVGTGKCPIDVLKIGACVDVLNGLISAIIGTPPKQPCCTLIDGLADLEAAVCLCTALKANILGINLNVPISLTLLVNYCGKSVPPGFQCP